MRSLAGVLAALLVTGCATIVDGTTQLISINSSPDGAAYVVKDEAGVDVGHGTTPGSITLKKGDGYFHGKDYTFLFSKDGYEGQIVALRSTTGNWYLWGNILVGGLIGWFIVDPLTGAMWKFDPESLSVTLVRSAAPASAPVRP